MTKNPHPVSFLLEFSARKNFRELNVTSDKSSRTDYNFFFFFSLKDHLEDFESYFSIISNTFYFLI